MPDEYISREAALMKLMQDGCSAKNLQSISDMPAADVAEVVRCKDCKNLVNTTINANCFLICDISDMEIAPEDFCSYGERMEE